MAKEEKAPKVVLSKAEAMSLEVQAAQNEAVVSSMGGRNAEAKANELAVAEARKSLKVKDETDPAKLRALRMGKTNE